MKLYVLAWGDSFEDIVQGIFTTKEKALESYEKEDSSYRYRIYEMDADTDYKHSFDDCVSWDPEVLLHPDDPFTI